MSSQDLSQELEEIFNSPPQQPMYIDPLLVRGRNSPTIIASPTVSNYVTPDSFALPHTSAPTTPIIATPPTVSGLTTPISVASQPANGGGPEKRALRKRTVKSGESVTRRQYTRRTRKMTTETQAALNSIILGEDEPGPSDVVSPTAAALVPALPFNPSPQFNLSGIRSIKSKLTGMKNPTSDEVGQDLSQALEPELVSLQVTADYFKAGLKSLKVTENVIKELKDQLKQSRDNEEKIKTDMSAQLSSKQEKLDEQTKMGLDMSKELKTTNDELDKEKKANEDNAKKLKSKEREVEELIKTVRNYEKEVRDCKAEISKRDGNIEQLLDKQRSYEDTIAQFNNMRNLIVNAANQAPRVNNNEDTDGGNMYHTLQAHFPY